MCLRLNIDDELMTEAMKASGAQTEREAVELGLKALLKVSRQADIRKLRGKRDWQGDMERGGIAF